MDSKSPSTEHGEVAEITKFVCQTNIIFTIKPNEIFSICTKIQNLIANDRHFEYLKGYLYAYIFGQYLFSNELKFSEGKLCVSTHIRKTNQCQPISPVCLKSVIISKSFHLQFWYPCKASRILLTAW